MAKKVLRSYQVVTSGNMASNITSSVTNVEFLDDISYQANMTGSPVGTIAIQGSLDYVQDQNGNVTNAGNWNTITSVAVSTAGVATIQLNFISSPWLRLIYTATSGTGSMTAYVAGKEI